MSEDSQTLRAAVVRTAQAMEADGLNHWASGNVSVRCGDGLLVTPSGIPARQLTPESVVQVGWDGAWCGPVKPSSEWRIHRDILQNRAAFKAVVHCHSPAAVALAVLGRGLPPFHYTIAVAGGPDVRCAPYATFGTQALSDHVVMALEGRSACFLAHHGMIAAGRSLDEALGVALEIEHLADVYLRLLPLGEPPLLSDRAVADALEMVKGYGANAQEQP